MKALQYLQVLALIAFLIYLVAFHLGNPATAAFPTGAGVAHAPVSLALLGGFAAGLVFAGLLALPRALRSLAPVRRPVAAHAPAAAVPTAPLPDAAPVKQASNP
ncbi:MAG TPA: hypothetical protein VHN99_12085 [Deinococcales bacterium]|nr:hypothetical protein [Deinococcales bacterium]